MKKFSIKVFIFLFPLFIVAVIFELSLRSIPNDYSYKKGYLENNAENIEVLILGNSHSYYGINPTYFTDNSFNACHISQSLDLDLEILKLYIDRLTSLKYIILPIDYFSLFAKTSNGGESWRIKNYNLYYGLDLSLNPTNYSELFSFNLKKNFFRIIGHYILKKSYITCSNLGYGIHKGKQANLVKTGMTAALRHATEDKSLFQYNIEIIDSILKISNEKQVSIILLTSPAYQTYFDNLEKDQLNITTQNADSLASEYPNCFYLNLLQDSSFSAEDFRDADHLNIKGAKKLSQIIDKEINKIKN